MLFQWITGGSGTAGKDWNFSGSDWSGIRALYLMSHSEKYIDLSWAGTL